ncbi:hypothetical protein XTPLMG728_0247 [Xanthomonas translucens pv. poae]|uniref:Secreted protein n=1 Tax=Xanthomonas graminis pv. poae TaxID=227946 RepID=A0A0K2ZDG6_9XANT|nr:hypothetical protein [Xanthomonas translucens]UKE63640.1 hypothetical protein KM539_09485 [Xanthomonas translucens pv. poae]CTP83556.1 hypothetical protein XTPLMG728_0247 [Xanthomonas translucens pv. poae]
MKSLWLPRMFMASLLAFAVQGLLLAMQPAPEKEMQQALAYVLKNDIVLSRTFGECPNLRFTRSAAKRTPTFLIEGSCAIKHNPEEDADCPAYHVHATGTIDTPAHWTVRQLQLKLVCSSEGAAAQRRT